MLLCGMATAAQPLLACAQAVQKTVASAAAQGPDLDLVVAYYSRVLTPEGVLRESRYEEKMLRRPGHVWVARVLPKLTSESHADAKTTQNEVPRQSAAVPAADEHAHRHFNHVVLARHVTRDGDRIRVEFVDAHDRTVIAIAPAEYENVDFDGSWANAFYLVDPQGVALLPLSRRVSPIAGARWHEREKNGLFQRVLWDDKRMIPLIVETGDRTGNAFRRIEIKPQAGLSKELPWLNLKNYAQKEYADFLD